MHLYIINLMNCLNSTKHQTFKFIKIVVTTKIIIKKITKMKKKTFIIKIIILEKSKKIKESNP